MSVLREPRFELRRRAELRAELIERAKVWLTNWRPREGGADFAGALFDIVARFESEVAQRLDRVPEKAFRGFLEWLGVRGQAGRAGRLPVVFSLAAGSEPVLATAPIQFQATPPQTDTAGSPEPVTFETEQSLMLIPGRLASLVGADPASDRFSLQPAGYSELDAPKPGPTEWTVKADALIGATQVQLEPALGLDTLPTLLHQRTNLQYRLVSAQGELVTLDPPIGTPNPATGTLPSADAGFNARDRLVRLPYFDSFGATERNRQEHAVYIGGESLLNLPAAAQVAIGGIDGSGITWSYWGKLGNRPALDWQTLSPVPDAPGLALAKPAGSVEIRDVAGKSSRWLRGTVAPGRDQLLTVSRISLTVNCKDGAPAACPPAAKDRSKIAVEGISNTTPLVLDTAFYPLGRDPRLFDAFYLGSAEAFSKKNAAVRICLEAVDATAAAMTAARATPSSPPTFFSVGVDKSLHRIQETNDPAAALKPLTAVRPPFTEAGIASVNAPPASLNQFQPARLSTLERPEGVLVAVTAGANVWLWLESPTAAQSRWYSLGAIADAELPPPPEPTEEAPPAVMMLKDADQIRAIAVRSGVLYEAVLPPLTQTSAVTPWKAVTIPDNLRDRKWVSVGPIFDKAAPMAGADFAHGWLALDDAGPVLFMRGADGTSEFQKKLGVGRIQTDVLPLAIRLDAAEMLVVAQKTEDHVNAWRVKYDKTVPAGVPLAQVEATVMGASFDWSPGGDDGIGVVFAAKLDDSAACSVALWYPRAAEAGDRSILFRSSRVLDINGAPAVSANQVVAPGTRGTVVAMAFHEGAFRRTDIAKSTLSSALVFENIAQPPVAGDFLEIKLEGSSKTRLQKIEDAPKPAGAHRFSMQAPGSAGGVAVTSATVYHRVPETEFDGVIEESDDVKDSSTLKMASDDRDNAEEDGQMVVFPTGTAKFTLHTIKDPKKTKLTLEPKVQVADGTAVSYAYVVKVEPRVLPLLDLATAGTLPPDGVEAMKQNGAFFRGAEPSPNRVMFLATSAAGAIEAALFEKPWTTAPKAVAGHFSVTTNGIFGQPQILEKPASGTPSLSWEYWDGQAWWKIKGLVDGTANLTSTGLVTFCVPPELQPTDVAGRKNHWIRARLVSGDYGQETVEVHTKPDLAVKDGTIQTIDRSRAGITPPLFASIDVQYSVCCAALPDFLITTDGGGSRDQTAANSVDAARVELFMPLSEAIRRAASAEPGTAGEKDRAIYLGFDAPLSGGPIGVLFLIEEGEPVESYPLRVDVLRETGFEPVVAEDGTRGLNESGVLTFALAGPPPAVALFGSEARYWMRLRPGLRLETAGDWRPKIRAAYLNAVYARAVETQDLERLGSSDGSPGQRVFLARPPVLEGTLELRVREPLDDDEAKALGDRGPNAILGALPNGDPGPWVLWTRVDDTDDAGPGDRAYALNHETGEIRFGDGLHGRIPPIGRDGIAAVTYKRGGGAAVNRVAAWSEINLISPVQGVERVIAPEGAAGGSDPQSAEEVVRFAPANQLMRDRVLTLRDLETLALESSRDIAQTKALPRGAGVRLVVAMRGRNPKPGQAQQRELARYLAERSSPALSAALTIEGPRLVAVDIHLKLTLDSIASSGEVARQAEQRVRDLLDPATGGLDRQGWKLGELPSDTDIAAALDGIQHLEEIDAVEISAAVAGAAVASAYPADLVVLAPEAISIEFETSDTEVPA